MKSKFTLLILLLSVSLTSFSQTIQRYCGHDHVMQKARTDNPNFDLEHDQFIAQAINENNLIRQNDTVYTVQVVFHILYKNGDPYQNVSDSLIQSQLDALNRDFNMRNADTADTRPIFKDIAGNARIEFVLAKKRPNGNCADAIIRKTYNAPSNFTPIILDFLVKEDLFGGSSAWNTNKYLNIWVLDLNKGRNPEEGFLGGYAYFPQMTPVNHNGVAIDYRFFGQNNPYITDVLPGFARYSMGRACVHEVGHWFGLRHIWGDLGTLDPSLGCTADDGINDTPNAATAYANNGSCLDTIVNSCVDEPIDFPDMFENFMDYSSDECQSMYTVEQVAVMRSSLLNFRPQLIHEPIVNETEVIYAEVIENENIELCFDLGECFGFDEMISQFSSGDSTYSSSKGDAQLVQGESCIIYNSSDFNADNDVDSFAVVVYDAHFNEYDTTIFVITIKRLCPTTQTIDVSVAEESVTTICLEGDNCLEGEYTLEFIGQSSTYNSNIFAASITDHCIEFLGLDYRPSDNFKRIFVVSNYGDVLDTTYINVTVTDVATGIELVNSKNNFIDVYPNPTNGLFTIEQNIQTNSDIKVLIYNTIGHVMAQSTITANQRKTVMDIKALSKGVYIVAFSTEDKISFEKLILE